MPVEVAVQKALQTAREAMGPEAFAEAHATLAKVFGNILNEPANEKFRMLKKANAIVKEKLGHPVCISALQLCGFQDLGDAYVLRAAADLTLMRKMSAALRAHPPETTRAAAPRAAPPTSNGTVTKMVNGVIVRTQVPKSSSCAAQAAAAAPIQASPAATAKAGGLGGSAGSKAPKSAFDFEKRDTKIKKEQEQKNSLEELRKQQRERYAAKAAGSGYSSAPAAAEPAAHPPSAPPQTDTKDQCVLQ